MNQKPIPKSAWPFARIRNASIISVAWKPSARWTWSQVSPKTRSGRSTLLANALDRDLRRP